MTFRDLDTISYKAELVWYCSVMPACPGHLQQDHGQAGVPHHIVSGVHLHRGQAGVRSLLVNILDPGQEDGSTPGHTEGELCDG